MNTLGQLKRMIKQEFDIEPAGTDADAPFASDDIDSLTLAELIFAIEDKCHVRVPDEAVRSGTTLLRFAQLVGGLIGSHNG